MEESGRIKRGVHLILLCTMVIWCSAEVYHGLRQVLGFEASRNNLFAMTGHFTNPGPYGGFIATIMAVSAAGFLLYRNKSNILDRIALFISSFAFLAGILVLPATMSRAAWLALIVGVSPYVLSDRAVMDWLRKHKYVYIVTGVALTALLAGAYLMKKQSADGRFHIWRIEAMAIKEKPLQGHGSGSLQYTYGETQERYFREHIDDASAEVVSVAGCPEYSFNEYLGIGVEHGIPGMLSFVAILCIGTISMFKHRNPAGAGLLAWAVFAWFSYPLSVSQLRVLLWMLAGWALLDMNWKMALPYAAATTAAMLWLTAADKHQDDYKELYNIGYRLHGYQEFEESNQYLMKGAALSSDPMFHVIMGKNYEGLGDFARAEEQYEKAMYMVPCRLYPRVRLMRLYIRMGKDSKALELGQYVLQMPVNVKNSSMQKLHEETEKTVDSLKTLKTH